MVESPSREDIIPYCNKQELYNYLQIKDLKKVPDEILVRIDQYNNEIFQLVNPVVVYNEFNNFVIYDKGIGINNVIIYSRVLSRILQRAKSVYLFILTIGGNLEKRVEDYINSNSLFAAQVADALGSIYVEALADFFMKDIEFRIERDGFMLSARYSPGYCDISISEQKKLFDLLKSENKYVILNDSLQMIPEKSISGIFFKMPRDEAIGYKKYFLFCSECEMKYCKHYKK
jgi:hypothetical protein